MKKLPNLTAVRREEVKTQADLDDMARIAAQHGFYLNGYDCESHDYNYYTAAKQGCRYIQEYLHDIEMNIISLAEFMSYDKDLKMEYTEDMQPVITKNEPLKTYERLVIGKCGTKVVVDVYRILDGFSTGNPILDHISKKSLCAGMRGHKDTMQDLIDIRDSIEEAIKLEGQR